MQALHIHTYTTVQAENLKRTKMATDAVQHARTTTPEHSQVQMGDFRR